MNNITALKNQSIISDLTSQISSSVKNIKSKQQPAFSVSIDKNATNHAEVSSFAFTYLEPSVVYNLHNILTEDAIEEQAAQRKNVHQEEDKEATQTADNASQEILFQDFISGIDSSTSKPNAQTVAKLYNSNSFSPIELIAPRNDNSQSMDNIRYATNTYNFNLNINTPSTVVIDFMHKYNQSYDYVI